MIIATYREHPNVLQKQAARSDVDTGDEDANERRSNKFIGWAYIDSHNFTASAWGTLSGSAFSLTLNVVGFTDSAVDRFDVLICRSLTTSLVYSCPSGRRR